MPLKIWDSDHQCFTVSNWIKSGLILKEGETYKGIYYHVMSIDMCQLCSVEFHPDVRNDRRCMDHSHKSGYFRQVICNKCNVQYDRSKYKTQEIRTKTGHRWIIPQIQKYNTKKTNTKVCVSFQFVRRGFKRKSSQSITKLICYSFIQMLKEPI